jgi:hypothetical protein
MVRVPCAIFQLAKAFNLSAAKIMSLDEERISKQMGNKKKSGSHTAR